jgi:hypothetical protein
MKKILFVVFGLLLSNLSHAQFGSLLGAASSAIGGGGGASLEQITSNYIAGSKQIASAQDKLMKAANIKVTSDLNSAQITNLTAGATSQQVDDANRIITDRSKAIQDAYANHALKLDANGQKVFMSGFGDFALGVLAYGKLALSVKGFSPSVNDISKAGMALAITKNIPDDMSNLKNTFGSIYDYAKSNNITPPKDSAEVTKMLDGF